MSKQPFRVTLLQVLVLMLTIWNAVRVWTSFAWREVLDEFSTQPTSTITTVSGTIWTLTGLIILWGVWQKKPWTANLLLGATAGYTVWYWSERLIWQSPHPNWPFAVIVNLVTVIFILTCRKALSQEAYERKIENKKTE